MSIVDLSIWGDGLIDLIGFITWMVFYFVDHRKENVTSSVYGRKYEEMEQGPQGFISSGVCNFAILVPGQQF